MIGKLNMSLTVGLIFCFGVLHSQEAGESLATDEPLIKDKVKFSGYIDAYYLYNFNEPWNRDRSPYVFAYHRHNELNLNLGFIKASYDDGKVFGNMAIQTGTYAEANYGAEEPVFRHINEANVGVRFTEKFSLDAGIFPSHIGVESAVAQDCYNLTRSLMADASPYFETGARLKYTFSKKWEVSALVLNGWQNIYETNDNKAVGTQITWDPTDNITINHSTFIGNEKPDNAPQYRYFQDFYIEIRELFPGFKTVFVVDHILEEQAVGGNFNQMVTGAWQLYYKKNKIGLGGRLEHYNDADEIINATGTPNGYQTTGASFNFDYYIKQGVMWRVEGRYLNAEDAIFYTNDPISYINNEAFVTTSLSISF